MEPVEADSRYFITRASSQPTPTFIIDDIDPEPEQVEDSQRGLTSVFNQDAHRLRPSPMGVEQEGSSDLSIPQDLIEAPNPFNFQTQVISTAPIRSVRRPLFRPLHQPTLYTSFDPN